MEKDSGLRLKQETDVYKSFFDGKIKTKDEMVD